MASTIAELVSVRRIDSSNSQSIHNPVKRQTDPSLFESIHKPEKMGNLADVAFGGNTLAVAVNAALQTIPPGFFLYSALGNYLGPVFTDRTLQCAVRDVCTTKTFATRHVELSQVQKDGEKRLCLFLSADFQAAEPASLLTYSRAPMMSYSAVEDSPTIEENRQDSLKQGIVGEETVRLHKELFGFCERFIHWRPCPEGFITQNLTGLANKGTPTTQDHLPLPARSSGDYFRSRHPLKTKAEHTAALAFVMDMGMLTLTGRSMDEVRDQASLEFALRVFTNGLDLNAWCLRELSTVVGGDGRTYNEAQVWDARGKMLCNMTQQCLLRPKL